MPKYVVSTTLKKADWTNSHIIKDNAVEEIRKLKEGSGPPSPKGSGEARKDILIFGSCKLSQSLLDMNLIDQYNLLVYPLVLGKGKTHVCRRK